MSARGNRRTFLGMAKLVGIAYISPLIAICYGVGKVVFRQRRMTQKLFVLSVAANLLFALFLLVGYLELRKDEQADVSDQRKGVTTRELVAPECFQRAQGPLLFCEAAIDSELNRLGPNTIYVASHGLIRARFEFTDEDLETLTVVTICDRHGRPWIVGNLDDRTTIYSRYADDVRIGHDMGLMDKDGDGIPDVMVNWDAETSFEPEQEITWRPIERGRGKDD